MAALLTSTSSRPKSAATRVSRPEYYGVPHARELTTYFEADTAVRARDERDYRSDHTASSFPLGSLKWNRRPPGNEYVCRTIFPPAFVIFPSIASSCAA